MNSRVIESAPVVFELLVLKMFKIIDNSKTEVFNFSGTERIKQNKNKN